LFEGGSAARAVSVRGSAAIRQPAPNTATSAAMTELAPTVATTRLLDVANAVGGFQPSAAAPATTRELLTAIPRPDRAIRDASRTTLAGRRHSPFLRLRRKLAQQTLINVCTIHFLDIG